MTTIDSWRDQLLHAVAGAGLLGRPRRVQLAGGEWALEGTLTIAGRAAVIALVVDPLFENKIPTVLLRPWDALGFIPHIDPSGKICYVDPEGMLLDQNRQLQIIRDCIAHVQRTLQAGVIGANRVDFVNEFEAYWSYLESPLLAISSLDPIDEVSEVVIATCPTPGAPLRLAHGARGIMHMADKPPLRGPWASQRAIYLPLEPDTLLVPPRPDRPFWAIEDLRALLAYCSEANRARLASLIAGPARDIEYVVFGLPRPAGGRALFGVRLGGVGDRHPLAEGGRAANLTPICIQRRDRGFLVQRGGGHMELESKRVLLLGCGSVGGQLAFLLARAGIGALTLVDHDILTAENTYRHVLGKPYWGKRKALAMKQALTAQLPFIDVGAIPETIEAAFEQDLIRLNDFDLIVSALGNPTAELALNERVRRNAGSPIVFTWLEPLGIGGHALLTGQHGEPGCFACLYTRTDGSDGPLQNRAAFGQEDQKYGRSLAGCNNLFTPYGALDAIRTSELAARLVLDALSGHEQSNVLRSWKGDATAFTEAGFELSGRYRFTEDELRRQEASYPSAGCTVCGDQTDRSD
jgi:molybdopterin/thiamine biosynthesis adenylyltransferase